MSAGMDHYIIGKMDLHKLLHMLGLLKPGEVLAYVDNLALLDASQENVGLGVSAEQDAISTGRDYSSLNDAQLKNLFIRIASMELMVHQQKEALKQEMERLLGEMEQRSVSTPLTEDLLPPDVQLRIDDEIARILSGDTDRSES